MRSIERSLLEMAARLLAYEDREVVLGDLAEAGVNAGQGVLEILGLVVRRQAALWRDWRPWLAAFGLALPGTLLLEGVSFSIGCASQRLFGDVAFGACGPTGSESIRLVLCHILLLGIWSWTGGFVVGSLSRRTLWLSIAIASSPCIYCLSRFQDGSLSRLCLLLFAPPAIIGIYHGLGLVRLKPRLAITLASVVTVLTFCAWLNSALAVFQWALIWPAWYMVAMAWRPAEQVVNRSGDL